MTFKLNKEGWRNSKFYIHLRVLKFNISSHQLQIVASIQSSTATHTTHNV